MIRSRRSAFRWYHDNHSNQKVKLAASLATILMVLITTVVILALPGPPRSFALVVDSGDCGLVVEASDEFVDTGNLNPGDLKRSYLVASNTKKSCLNYYFDIQITGSVAGEYPGLDGRHLEEVLVIKIEVDGVVLFEGLLTEFEEIDMGILMGYDSQRIDVSVYFPGEAGNEYQGASVSVVFKFRSECLCVPYCDETAWAYGDGYANPNWDYAPGNNWGWTNGPLGEGHYTFELWAGAGRNDLDNGTQVGEVDVFYEDGCVSVSYRLWEEEDRGIYLGEAHLWVGNEPLPTLQRGRTEHYTDAPGQFLVVEHFDFAAGGAENTTAWTWSSCPKLQFEGEIYVAAHGVVWIEGPCQE